MQLAMSEEGSRQRTKLDWDDQWGWDRHFGMEVRSARDPYTNRGRTDAVWKTLEAYGFRKSNEKGKTFDGLTPNPCFECFVRKSVKKDGNIRDDGT